MSHRTCTRMACTDVAAIKVGDLELCGRHYKQHVGWTS